MMHSKPKQCYDVKVTGFEEIVAESEEEALEKFNQMLENGYKVIDLRWKVVVVDKGEP